MLGPDDILTPQFLGPNYGMDEAQHTPPIRPVPNMTQPSGRRSGMSRADPNIYPGGAGQGYPGASGQPVAPQTVPWRTGAEGAVLHGPDLGALGTFIVRSNADAIKAVQKAASAAISENASNRASFVGLAKTVTGLTSATIPQVLGFGANELKRLGAPNARKWLQNVAAEYYYNVEKPAKSGGGSTAAASTSVSSSGGGLLAALQKSAQQIIATAGAGSSAAPTSTALVPISKAAPAAAAPDNTKSILLGVGAVAIGLGALFILRRPKKDSK